MSEIPLGKLNEVWLNAAVSEFPDRGGRVVAQPMTDSEWLTIGAPINYLKVVIEYALVGVEMRKEFEPIIRSLLES